MLWRLSSLGQLGAGIGSQTSMCFLSEPPMPLHCGLSARPSLINIQQRNPAAASFINTSTGLPHRLPASANHVLVLFRWMTLTTQSARRTPARLTRP